MSLRSQFFALAEKQGTTAPLIIGHRLMGLSLQHTGGVAEGRAHLDRGIALYDPAEHRPLAARFGQDPGASLLSFRALASMGARLSRSRVRRHTRRAQGRPRDRRSRDADVRWPSYRGPLLLPETMWKQARSLNLPRTLADAKGRRVVEGVRNGRKGCIMALTGKVSDAVQMITSGITAFRSTGATYSIPLYSSHLARAYAETGSISTNAWRCIGDAMAAVDTTKETMVRSRNPSHRRGNRVDVDGTGGGKSRNVSSSERSRWRASSRQSPGNCERR